MAGSLISGSQERLSVTNVWVFWEENFFFNASNYTERQIIEPSLSARFPKFGAVFRARLATDSLALIPARGFETTSGRNTLPDP